MGVSVQTSKESGYRYDTYLVKDGLVHQMTIHLEQEKEKLNLKQIGIQAQF